jgi:uncharacterized protein YndB with AHSA1/START domain
MRLACVQKLPTRTDKLGNMTGLLASADIDISAPPERVWAALTDPKEIAKYMFGTSVEATWRPGSSITWSGEWEGKPYQDKGEILEVEQPRRLKLTHFSPLTGQEDRPENYHTVTYELTDRGGSTHVALSQDNNADQDEADRASATWTTMLTGLKETVESG